MAEFPRFHDPNRIGTLFYPDVAGIAAEAAAAQMPPASADQETTHLVIIDMQVDFCHPRGSLHVPGALADIRRTIEFIYRNAERITQITCSLDSHLPRQIFSPGWWADKHGAPPAPFTVIIWADVQGGVWRPLVEPEASVAYVKTLEQQHKKQLCIWPYHTMTGAIGHALDPELWSAVFWHALARQTTPIWLSKGGVALTEHYSIIQPEVPVPDQPGGSPDLAFLEILDNTDRIFIAGEAESHCVLETMEDLVEHFGDQPEALAKIFFLHDCASPVLHPEIDFHAISLQRLAEFEEQGINLIQSTDPWPL